MRSPITTVMLALLLFAKPANADPSKAEIAQAKTLKKNGDELVRDKHFEEALRAYDESYARYRKTYFTLREAF